MNKFGLTIYNSALLLLLVVQYSARVYGDKLPQSKNPKLVGYRSVQPPEDSACQFSIDVRTTNTLPLLIQTPPTGTQPEFYYPNLGAYIIKLTKTEEIRLACPGKDNAITKFSHEGETPVSDIIVTCKGKNLFTYEGQSFIIDEIECKLPPASVLRYTSYRCLQNVPGNAAKYVEIGFELKSNNFLTTIDVCWDNTTKTTYWTAIDIFEKIEAVQECDKLKVREPDISFPKNENGRQYDISIQRETVLALTESNELVAKYIRKGDGKSIESRSWVSRAALSRKWGFVYYAAQMTTEWWINHVPQWSCFNNWEILENSIGSFVAELEYPLVIYTGTHGQMSFSLKDSKHVNTTESVPYYLHIDKVDPSRNAIPVPKYFWKIVHNPDTQKGLAFVGVNDPWATPENAGVKDGCRQISTNLKWLRWQPENTILGLSYVCEVEELRKIIPTLPELIISGNLV